MQKKQDTTTKYLNITISSKDVLVLEKVIYQYMLEQEALAYKNTKDIDAYSVYRKIRNLITLSHHIAKEAYDANKEVSDILDNVEQSIFNITQNRLKGGFTQINPILLEALEKLEQTRSKGGTVIGVPSGLLDLDDGSQVRISQCKQVNCSNFNGKIKSPLCCGNDMSCSI